MQRIVKNNMESRSLLSLPPLAILEVLRRLDGPSLVALQQTNSYFSRKEPGSRLPLVEHVARQSVLLLCDGSSAQAERFRLRSWCERLHLEESTGAGFDRAFSEDGGFRFQFSKGGDAVHSVRLTGMGPKLLVSDASTREQGVLRWRMRVKGNTAVEFGIIPADLEPSHTALHKCTGTPGSPHQRAMGFCSQITAGSLLPLKAPVMRGTVLDVVARRGHLEVVLSYPEDAKEISWQNGQPVQRPYRGPSQLRFEQDFPADYNVRLAVTSWAKAHFDVLHSGYSVAPGWAAETEAAEEAAAGYATAEAEAAGAAGAQPVAADLLTGAEPAVAAELAGPPLGLGLGLEPASVEYEEADAVVADDALLEVPPVWQAQQLQQMVAGAVQAAAQHAADVAAGVPPLGTVQQLADGLQADPVLLAMVAADGLAGAEPLALLHEQHAAMQQQQQQFHYQQQQQFHYQQQQAAELLSDAAAALQLEASGAHLMAASLERQDGAPAAAAQGSLLCPVPPGELCKDGHLQAPSQG